MPDIRFGFPTRRAILHDEDHYPDAAAFNPDRFLRLTDGGAFELDPSVRDPSVAAFGFGRRICPGRYMAMDSVWLTIARALAVFHIGRVVGPDGCEVVPDGEYDRGFLWYVFVPWRFRKVNDACFAFTSHPKPFPWTIKPRSKGHEALLMELIAQDS